MKVSPEIIQKWAGLRERGDNAKISKLLKIKPQSVANLFNTEVMTSFQIRVINAFYEKKEQAIKKIIQEVD